jgi:hypothetical protein
MCVSNYRYWFALGTSRRTRFMSAVTRDPGDLWRGKRCRFRAALIDVLDAVEFGDVGCAGPLGAFGAESAIRMVLRGNKPRARPRFRAHDQRGRRRVSDSVPVRRSRSSLDSSLDCGPDGRWRVGNEEISWGESVFVSACEEGAALRSAVLRSFGLRREVAHIRRSWSS